MHGWVDSEISAVLLALIVIVVVSLAFAHQVTSRSSRRLKKSQRIAGDVGVIVQREEQFEADRKSMLGTSNCVVCQKSATPHRCSKCKSAKYCSSECQKLHWRSGHRNECHVPVSSRPSGSGGESVAVCNGKHPETSKSGVSTTVLNPISLGIFKSDSNKSTSVKKSSPSQVAKIPGNALTKDGSLPRPKSLLFSYDDFVKLFEWDALDEPCGLVNCGNSCFANVVLQCLTYTRPLTAYLLNDSHREVCRRNDWCFMCELQSHVRKVRETQNPFSPIRILSRIRSIGSHLGYGKQEDAHEFMRFAIDSMQSTCLDEFGGEKAVDPATQETTLIHHIFGGHLQSQVKCMECHHESNRYESMMDLAVEIHGVVESLEDAIAQFTAAEMLDGDNKYKCDRCNAYVRAGKRLTVHEAPNILTIALKRFQSGKFGKLNKRVTFPKTLDMSPYMSGTNDDSPLYGLYAVVVHVDLLNASFFGHYICYVKDSNGVWYKIDDSKVKEVELEKVLAQKAYMLFYTRSGVRKAPMTQGHPPAILASPQSASKKISTSVCLKPERSSIFPPTLGAVAVPTDLLQDYSKDTELIGLKQFEDKARGSDRSTLQNPGEIIQGKETEDSTKENGAADPVPVSTFACQEEILLEEARSSNDSFSASNIASTSQTLNGHFSSNGNLVPNGLSLDATNDGLDWRENKFTPDKLSPLSTSKRLGVDQLEVYPLVDNGSFSPRPQVDDFGRTLSLPREWAGGINDLFSSNSHSGNSEYSADSSPSGAIVEKERRSLNEADVWNDVTSDRTKRQHTEDSSENLGSADAHMNGDSQHMDIDEGNTSIVDVVLHPHRSNEALTGDGAGCSSMLLDVCQMSDNGGLPQSSNSLLELESLYSQSTLELMPSIITHGAGIEPMEIAGSSPFLSSPHRGRVLIEELPGPVLNGGNDMCTAKVTESNMPTREETHDVGVIQDDIPCLVAKSPLAKPATPQVHEGPTVQQQDTAGHLMGTSRAKVHVTVVEASNGVKPTTDTINTVITGEERIKSSVSALDVKRTNQTSKPLFSPGFLIKNSRPTSGKPLIRSNDAVANGRGGEENGHGHSIETSRGLSNGRPASVPVTNGTEGGPLSSTTNGESSCQVTINGAPNDGNPKSRKKPKDPPLDSGRENDPMDRSRSLKHKQVKQGRNDSCGCGSQQKWKKCCGRGTVLKGLASKQVTV